MIINIEVGKIISKSGTKFKVLGIGGLSAHNLPPTKKGRKKTTNKVEGRLILLEQMDGDKVIAYEVCRSYYGKNWFDFNPETREILYEHIPSAEQFGKFVLDRSFPLRKRGEAFDWFSSHVVSELVFTDGSMHKVLEGGNNVMHVKVNPDGGMPDEVVDFVPTPYSVTVDLGEDRPVSDWIKPNID